MSEMTCTVTITWLDAKKKKEVVKCDKYVVNQGVIACETRTRGDDGDIVNVKTVGFPLNLIANYKAEYEKINVIEEQAEGSEKE